NPGYPNSVDGPLQCSLQVKKCSSNICQLRLDFHAFGIAQPEVQSATNANLATQCTTDAFTVTGVSNNVPVICGLNTNQHIYLDMTTNTDMFTLSFALGSVTGPPGQTFETSNQRYWNIKVSQIPCDGTIRAPDGCLQYYTAASGRLTSFNFDIVTPDNSRHLANQDYGICIRMAQGYCGICYTVCDSVDNAFSVSLGYNPNSGSYTTSTNGALPSVCTTDYVTILGAFIPQTGTQGNQAAQYADRICGTAFSTANTNGAANAPATVCLFSIFSVVRFSNDMCGSGTYNGTCLTAAECFAAGGSSNNTCAAGFGVCCVFLYRTCGGSTNRNCTYFQSPDYPSSSVSSSLQCSFTVNKCSADICQVRLDFLAFGLAQPETQSATNYPLATQCTTDSFTVTGASNNVPAICGLNTGQH
ncbi:hypothetical protein QYM36_005000, partial [Artemia franciscana]